MPKPTYSPTLYPLDCRKAARRLRSNTVSAIVTDPPYGLKFMGKEWDHGVPGVQFWQTFLRVCKPGAMLLAFGGTRTYHRLACAIEDAGWEIRDCIMWVYGSGFPKSHNISKSLDKAAGAEREVVGRKTGRAATPVQDIRGGSFAGGHGKNSAIDCSAITAPATDAAKLWDGWGTALKPSYEPVILAMKPLDGTFANNAVKHGVAGINVDGCRIPGTPHGGGHHAVTIYGSDGNYIQGPNVPGNPEGRFPANLIHDGSEEVVGLFPKTTSGGGNKSRRGDTTANNCYGTYDAPPPDVRCIDSGSAARFFYCAKASKAERGEGNKHPTVKPLDLMSYLCRLVSMPEHKGTLLDPFMGSGSTLLAATCWFDRVIGIDSDEESCKIAANRLRQGVLF